MRINIKFEAPIIQVQIITKIIYQKSAHACDVSLGASRRAHLSQSYVFLLRDWFAGLGDKNNGNINIFQLSLKTSWCSYMIIFSVAYR